MTLDQIMYLVISVQLPKCVFLMAIDRSFLFWGCEKAPEMICVGLLSPFFAYTSLTQYLTLRRFRTSLTTIFWYLCHRLLSQALFKGNTFMGSQEPPSFLLITRLNTSGELTSPVALFALHQPLPIHAMNLFSSSADTNTVRLLSPSYTKCRCFCLKPGILVTGSVLKFIFNCGSSQSHSKSWAFGGASEQCARKFHETSAANRKIFVSIPSLFSTSDCVRAKMRKATGFVITSSTAWKTYTNKFYNIVDKTQTKFFFFEFGISVKSCLKPV